MKIKYNYKIEKPCSLVGEVRFCPTPSRGDRIRKQSNSFPVKITPAVTKFDEAAVA